MKCINESENSKKRKKEVLVLHMNAWTQEGQFSSLTVLCAYAHHNIDEKNSRALSYETLDLKPRNPKP